MTLTIVETRLVTGGVDTHAGMHVAAALDTIGGLLGVSEFPATPAGYARLLDWLGSFGTVALVGVEGTGSYGAGLARYLDAAAASTRGVQLLGMAHLPVIVRAAETQQDLDGISKIDRAYSASRIYRVRRGELGFWLEVEPVSPPVQKTYPDPSPELSDRLLVAAAGPEIVGYGELRFNSWNDRAEIEGLTVSGKFRGQGIGRSLVRALDERARRERSARCLWLETQNINYPAVQFYRRLGFRLCGLDETLYRPGMPGLVPGEVALYFSRDL